MKANEQIERLEREDEIIAECSDLINLLIRSRKIESTNKPYIVDKMDLLESMIKNYKGF